MKKNFKNKKIVLVSIVVVVLMLSLVVGVVIGINQKKNAVSNSKEDNIMAETKNEKTSKKDEYTKRKREALNIGTEKDIEQETFGDSKIEQENYSEEYKEYQKKSDVEKKKVEVIPRKREVKYEELDNIIEREQEIVNEKEQEEKLTKPNEETEKIEEQSTEPEEQKENTLPVTFNLKDVIPIKVASQENFGLCWDFAAMKCVETNLALTQGKNYDFSEIHVDYLTSNAFEPNARDIHKGGNFETFIKYTEKFNGFIAEEELEYRDYSKDEYMAFINMDKIDESVYEYIDFPSYRMENNDWTEEEFKKYQDAIKTHIMNFGSLYTSTEALLEGKNTVFSKDKEDYQANPVDRGHAMSIIGWDDNYPKENFTSINGKKPEKDGAYIVLNSWGDFFDDGGIIYISYEDYSVHRQISGVVSTDKKDLINISTLGNKAIANYLEKEFKDKIIVYNNNKYLRKNVLDKYEYDLSNLGLTSLEDIDIFQSAYSLNLANNRLTDVSALNSPKFKKMYSLDLSNNLNVSGWENLTNVNSLKLRNCNLTDISTLSNWSEMEDYIELDLSENPNMKGLEVLKKLKISRLELSYCNIEDLTIFENESIVYLDLSGNKEIINLERLNNFKGLGVITLRDCDIKDASIFDKMQYFYVVDLSDNKGIKNLNKIKTSSLYLENCDIENLDELSQYTDLYTLNLRNNKIKDITPLKNMNISELLLSGNKDITGDLKDSKIYGLELNNCNLNDDFDMFNLESIESLYLKENKITLEKVLKKVNCNYMEKDEVISEDELEKLPKNEHLFLNGLTVEKTVKVPRGNVRVYLLSIIDWNNGNIRNVKVKNGIYNDSFKFVEFNSEDSNKLIIENYSNWKKNYINCKLIINFEIDDTIKPEKLIMTKPLKKSVYNTGEHFTTEGLEVAELYENEIYKKETDYELIIPEKLMFGTNEIKMVKDSVEGVLKIRYLGIENETDTFTLTFKTQEMFERVFLIFDKEILQVDTDNKTMVLYNKAKTKFSQSTVYIDDSLLDDIESLEGVDIKEFNIVYNGNKITIEDLQRIKNIFPNMTKLCIENCTDEQNEDIVPKQNLFEITVYKDDSVG